MATPPTLTLDLKAYKVFPPPSLDEVLFAVEMGTREHDPNRHKQYGAVLARYSDSMGTAIVRRYRQCMLVQ